MKNLIINLAPTGIVPTKSLTPHVPLSTEEIFATIEACMPFGVSMIHLHVRDEFGKPTYKKDIYARIIYKIREHYPNVIIVVSTSGRLCNEFEKRSEVLELTGDVKPDMASLTLSSLNFSKTTSVNSPDMIVRLAEKMLANDIKPELEVFGLGMANFANHLKKKGLIKPPYYFNILLGNIATAQSKLSHVGLLTTDLPEDSIFCFAGIGNFQKKMNALGVIDANGVRVGLEDNIWFDEERTKKATNYDLVKRIYQLSKILDRKIATPEEVRTLLKLEPFKK